jgi:hypothetical protein
MRQYGKSPKEKKKEIGDDLQYNTTVVKYPLEDCVLVI